MEEKITFTFWSHPIHPADLPKIRAKNLRGQAQHDFVSIETFWYPIIDRIIDVQSSKESDLVFTGIQRWIQSFFTMFFFDEGGEKRREKWNFTHYRHYEDCRWGNSKAEKALKTCFEGLASTYRHRESILNRSGSHTSWDWRNRHSRWSFVHRSTCRQRLAVRQLPPKANMWNVHADTLVVFREVIAWNECVEHWIHSEIPSPNLCQKRESRMNKIHIESREVI